jgi:DNA polymerase-4
LLRLGLRTVGDLAHTPRATLQRALGRAVGSHLAELAWGRDRRPVVASVPEKSTGADETFPHDVDDPAYVHRELLRLSERTAGRLRAAGLAGRTVSLKVRFADFSTITRARTLADPTDVGQQIYAVARELYDALGLERARIRLVGVRVEGLVPVGTSTRQLALGEREHGWRDAEVAADRAARRFGTGAVRPAALVRGDDRRRTGAGDRSDPSADGREPETT